MKDWAKGDDPSSRLKKAYHWGKLSQYIVFWQQCIHLVTVLFIIGLFRMMQSVPLNWITIPMFNRQISHYNGCCLLALDLCFTFTSFIWSCTVPQSIYSSKKSHSVLHSCCTEKCLSKRCMETSNSTSHKMWHLFYQTVSLMEIFKLTLIIRMYHVFQFFLKRSQTLSSCL